MPASRVEPSSVIGFAPAKINLTLRIVGRRTDGYHLIDSLIAFAAVGDVVRAEPAPSGEITLRLEGPFAAGLTGADNLVLRAARLLAEATPGLPGAKLVLDKHLPVASGIGGGSADAAATLRLLAPLWNSAASIPDIAAHLGADVPVCLSSVAARMRGIGEQVTKVPLLPPLGLVLVNPGVALSTAAVFAASARASAGPNVPAVARGGDEAGDGPWTEVKALAAALRKSNNDLETAAIALCPPIAAALTALRAMPDCLVARMSGSGATCFGLFGDADQARKQVKHLHVPPAWWRWGGGLYADAVAGLEETAGNWGVAKW